jgi:hypothetical protein
MKKRLTILFVSLGLIAAGLISVGQISFVSATTCITEASQFESGDISYTVLQFKTAVTCQWTIPDGVISVDYLIVAGGGGGGSDNAGGGGGGGVLSGTMSLDPDTPNSTFSIVVGAGGAASGNNNANLQTNGGDSSAFGLTAFGGGQGGNGQPGARAATSGGSGGGGHGENFSGSNPSTAGANGIAGQGNKGGNGNTSSTSGQGDGGGGGGAGAAGVDAASGNPGAGGAGFQSNITGTTLFYGSGGGGGTHRSSGSSRRSGAGGSSSGGGGGGVLGHENGGDGEDGFGGGGGGSATTSFSGGAGGSGVVIVRYITPPTITNTNGIVMLVDPRSESVPIPYLTVTSGAPSRICFDLKSSDDDLLILKTFSNANTDSDKFRMAVTFNQVTVGADAKITATRANAQALLKRNVSNSESYLRLYRPDSGWSEVDGGKLKVRVDYAQASECSGVSGTEINIEIPIRVLRVKTIQKNPVDLSRG